MTIVAVIMHSTTLISILVTESAIAFPFVPKTPGVDSSLFRKAGRDPHQKRQSSCPFNSLHQGAAPYSAEYPYTGAQDGLPGTGKGGILVPAAGDVAHAFKAPGPNDIRGPCPGLNAAANHQVSCFTGVISLILKSSSSSATTASLLSTSLSTLSRICTTSTTTLPSP